MDLIKVQRFKYFLLWLNVDKMVLVKIIGGANGEGGIVGGANGGWV